MVISPDTEEGTVKEMAISNEGVVKFITDDTKIIKVIYVKNKLINIVIK
jgi:leucyl-tRNA synthetase